MIAPLPRGQQPYSGKARTVAVVLVILAACLHVFPVTLLNAGMLLVVNGLTADDAEMLHSGQLALRLHHTASGRPAHEELAYASLDSTNLVRNGGFEFRSWGWQVRCKVHFDREQRAAGYQSLRADIAGVDETFYHVYQDVDVQPGRCYSLDALIRADGGLSGIGLDVWDATGGYRYWYGGATDLVSAPCDWTPVHAHFCVPSNVDKVQLRLRVFSIGNGGTLWCDDVRLEASGGIP